MRAFLLALAVSASSCAASSPSERVVTEFLAASVPGGSGWEVSNASPSAITLSRRGEQPEETFVASVTLFRIEPPRDREHFLSLIQRGVAADTPPGRYRELQAHFQQDTSRGHLCVRYSSLHEDKQAKLLSGGTGKLNLRSMVLYCVHPDEPAAAYAVGYSRRGLEAHEAFEKEAEQFIGAAGLRGREPNNSSKPTPLRGAA